MLHIVTQTVYPHLVDLIDDQLKLNFQNQAKNISVVHPSSPIKIWGQSVKGFTSYETNEQTDKQRIQLYLLI